MAPRQPAYVLQNRQDHSAQLFRMALAGLATGPMAAGATSPVGGVHSAFGNRLAVTGTAGMSVNVDTGVVYMGGSTAWQGMYAGYNDASYSVVIGASSSTQWRQDYIAARQHDTAYGDGDNNWDIVDVQGAFSSSAPGVLPALPNNAVPLAIVKVTPNMSVTNGGGTIVDARQYAPAGRIITTSANPPPLTAPEGTEWYETDTHMSGIIINGAYKYLHYVPYQAYDSWHSLSGLTFTAGWSLAADLPVSGYRLFPADPTCLQFIAALTPPQTPTANLDDGTTIFTMPSGWRPNTNYQRIPLMTVQVNTPSSGNPFNNVPFLRFGNDGSVAIFGLWTWVLQGYSPAAHAAEATTVFANGIIRLT